jgi:FkbM family methyltransferase
MAAQLSTLPLAAKVLRGVLRSRVRGRTRLTLFLASRFDSLQAVPIPTESGAVLFADLRIIATHSLLVGTPGEVNEQEVMQRLVRPGDVVLDVGAHVGYHTIWLSKLVGQSGTVYAFEPNPEAARALQRTVDQLGNASLLPYALSDEHRDSVLFVPGDPSMASLRQWIHLTPSSTAQQRKTRKQPCQECRIDDLIESGIIRQPDFIKCDVEGGELLVFRGGSKALDRVDAPILLFEAGPDTSRGFGLTATSALEFLASLQLPAYSFFQVCAGRLGPLPEGAIRHSNMVAIPKSRLSSRHDLNMPPGRNDIAPLPEVESTALVCGRSMETHEGRES